MRVPWSRSTSDIRKLRLLYGSGLLALLGPLTSDYACCVPCCDHAREPSAGMGARRLRDLRGAARRRDGDD